MARSSPVRNGLLKAGLGLAGSLTGQLVWWLVGAGALGLLWPAPGRALRPLTSGILALLLVGIGFGAGWLAGLGGTGADRRTLAFTTGMREFGIATAVALAFFGPEAALFPAIYGVVMMVGSAWLARRSRMSRTA